LSQKFQQDLPGCGYIHVMEVYCVGDTELAASQAPQNTFLVSGAQKEQFFACFKLRDGAIVFQQFLKYQLIILFSLDCPCRRFLWHGLYAIMGLQWRYICHRFAKVQIIGSFLV